MIWDLEFIVECYAIYKDFRRASNACLHIYKIVMLVEGASVRVANLHFVPFDTRCEFAFCAIRYALRNRIVF